MKKHPVTQDNKKKKEDEEEDASHGDELMTLHLLSPSDGGTKRIRLLMTFRRIIF